METACLAGDLKIYVSNEMEQYRADSFYDKEPETIEWIKRFDGGIFIDVGANIGIYSLYAAHLHPEMTVYAIEPVFENYRRLIDNIELNGLENIIPINAGVSNRSGLNWIYLKSDGVGDSGSQLSEPFDEYGNEYYPTDKRLVTQFSLNALSDMIKPDYIKIDVDGRERTILGGGSRAIRRAKSLLIELNTKQISVSAATAYIGKNFMAPDNELNNLENHSNARRGGNPVNMIYASVSR